MGRTGNTGIDFFIILHFPFHLPFISSPLFQKPGSFLELCLHARNAAGKPFSDHEIVNQMFLAVLSGTDSTANALSFATHLLSTHGAAMDTLLAEIDANAPPGTPALTLADSVCSVKQWPYLDAVFREALRLYPPILSLARELSAATRVEHKSGSSDAIKLAAGTWVVTPLRLLHTDTAVWGPTAADFVPERWLPGHAAAAPADAIAKAYLPFGDGARRCPAGSGRGGLAELQFKVVLVSLLQRVAVRPVPGQGVPIPVRETSTMAPRDGLTVMLTKRHTLVEA